MKAGSGASLEKLVESGDLGLEVLHPGGLEMTREIARLCGVVEGSEVLDVAAGTGESACFLAQHFGCRVVGVDASETMVERARRKAQERGLAAEFVLGDAHRLPFASERFDVVLSECTLCLLQKERALGEMARVARPGGHVGMHDICWKPGAPEAIKRRLAEIEGERPERVDGWVALFERTGLTDVTAVDRSAVIPEWMRAMRKRLGLRGQLSLVLRALSRWGVRGLRDVWRSQRIFASPHLGYAIVVGAKLERGASAAGRPTTVQLASRPTTSGGGRAVVRPAERR